MVRAGRFEALLASPKFHAALALFGLYLLLVGYGFLYHYFLSEQLLNLFHTDWLRMDGRRIDDYRWAEFLTPLAMLPLGTRLHAPGQYIAGLLGIFIFIPVPIVFLPLVTSPQYWMIYANIWVGVFLITLLSQYSLPVEAVTLSELAFARLTLAVFSLIALGLALSAQHGLHFGSFEDAGRERAEASLGPLGGYAVYMYTSSFGGLAVVYGLLTRNWAVIALALVGYVLCYGILSIKTAALAPLWLVYYFFGRRFWFRDSVLRYICAIILPFALLCTLPLIVGQERGSITYEAFTLVNYRLFTIPAAGFGYYYNFFQVHPITYWSHINVVSDFVRYPYASNLGAVMQDAYHFGNYNTNFLASDGVAGGGVAAIPYVSLVFGFVLILLNTAMRGLNPIFIATTMALPALTFIDSPIATALLTNGIGSFAILCFFAPREAKWLRPPNSGLRTA